MGGLVLAGSAPGRKRMLPQRFAVAAVAVTLAICCVVTIHFNDEATHGQVVQEEVAHHHHGHKKYSIQTSSSQDELSEADKALIVSATLHNQHKPPLKEQETPHSQSLFSVGQKGRAHSVHVEDEDKEDELSEEDKALIAAAGASFNAGFKKPVKKLTEATRTSASATDGEMMGTNPVEITADPQSDDSDPEHLQEQLAKITQKATEDAVKTVIGGEDAPVNANTPVTHLHESSKPEKPKDMLRDVENSAPYHKSTKKAPSQATAVAILGHPLEQTAAEKEEEKFSPEEARKIVYGTAYHGPSDVEGALKSEDESRSEEPQGKPPKEEEEEEEESPDAALAASKESQQKLAKLDAKADAIVNSKPSVMRPQDLKMLPAVKTSIHQQALGMAF